MAPGEQTRSELGRYVAKTLVVSGAYFATAKIGLELRNQYVLGYSPKNPARDGKYRKVEVKLVKVKDLPPLRARFRAGYVAPTQ